MKFRTTAKKLLALLLCGLLLASLLPTATASGTGTRGGDVILPPDDFSTKISEVFVRVQSPIAGKTAAECLTAPELSFKPAGSAELIESSLTWYNLDGSYFTGNFEAGKEYSYYFELKPKSGYQFKFDGDNYLGVITAANCTLYYTECCGAKKDTLAVSVKVTAERSDGPSFVDLPSNTVSIDIPDGERGDTAIREAFKQYCRENITEDCGIVLIDYKCDLGGSIAYHSWSVTIADGSITCEEGGFGNLDAVLECIQYYQSKDRDWWAYGSYTAAYTITFEMNGYGAQVAPQTVNEGDTAAEPDAPTESGYIFGGWYQEVECRNPFDFSTPITADTTLYAKWTESVAPVSITRIEVIAEAPVAGKTPAESMLLPTFSTTPDNAAALIESSLTWYNLDGSYFTGIFEAGKQYAYYMEFMPKDGYQFEFDGDDYLGTVVANGEAPRYTECGGSDGKFLAFEAIVVAKDPCEGYTDINRSAWYHTAADFVISRGLMGSTKTDKLTFEPNTKVSRAMVASILYRMANSPAASYKATFTDVPEGKWFTAAIEWCAQNGLASGKGNGKFDPNGNVTRQELAVFMKKMAEYLEKPTDSRDDLTSFADASQVPSWAKDYVAWAVSAGLISGKVSGGKTYLAPTDNATRAEFASIIMRFVRNIAES